MEEYLKEFNEYKYIVLCNGLFDAGFKNLNDALDHCANQKKPKLPFMKNIAEVT